MSDEKGFCCRVWEWMRRWWAARRARRLLKDANRGERVRVPKEKNEEEQK
jgi:hypothetical protein